MLVRSDDVITATFKEKDNRYYLSVNGHACYADKGQDIVCAYVSGLVIATVNEMQEYGAEITSDETISTSFIAVQTSQRPIDFHLFRLFKMLLDNLQEIEQQYPENIKVVVSND